jgi:MYXO-CTERM domain-containing protein
MTSLAICPADGGVDAGMSDAGSTDAGTNDAGSEDAGTSDAGSEDAGTNDAGPEDAGVNDAGLEDGGMNAATTRELAVSCGCSGGGDGVLLLGLALLLGRRSRAQRRTDGKARS